MSSAATTTASTRFHPPTKSRSIESASGHVVGIALIFLGAGLVVCAAVDTIMSGDQATVLLSCALINVVLGGTLRAITVVPAKVRPASAFSAVSFTWIAASLLGALPYMLTGAVDHFDHALFESVSGFTCTGSSIFTKTSDKGSGLLFWRQMTQWFGGMGMVVLAVAVLPTLGVGGLDLIGAESPGEGAERLAPRVRDTALRLWGIYCAFTLALVVALLAVGLTLFQAFGHAMATVATGGFSTEDSSVGSFDSVWVESVIVIGMIVCGMSFGLHTRTYQRRSARHYLRNSETRMYGYLLFGGIALVTALNTWDGMSFGLALREAWFNVPTLVTSTGFGNVRGPQEGSLGNFVEWGGAVQVIFLLLMVVGGTTGSTAGGMKVMRLQVMFRLAVREIKRARRPRAVLLIKQGSTVVPERIVDRIVGFVLIYLSILGVGTVAIALFGDVTLLTAIGSATNAIGNMGPGLEQIGPADNFTKMAPGGRAVMMAMMLIGRLEIFAVLLMFSSTAHRVRGADFQRRTRDRKVAS